MSSEPRSSSRKRLIGAFLNGMSRREELLAVATKLFAARGYHGTRMDDVADAVGLNKATVYHYYASKSLILYDIYKSAADFTVDALHDDPTATARETIYHFTRAPAWSASPATSSGRPCTSRRAPTSRSGSPRSRSPTSGTAETTGLRARPRRHRPRHRQRRVLRLRLARPGPRLHRHDAQAASFRWLRPQGRGAAQEIAVEFSTALLRGLIKDEAVRIGRAAGH